MTASVNTVLAHITAKGVVQGVGFRPFIFRLAKKHHLNGWVSNTSESVIIEIEGPGPDVESFYRDIASKAPPLARIENLSIIYGNPASHTDFQIRPSTSDENKYQLVSPDIATCNDCRNEIFDPSDRRHRYPFTNCTNCGPRFTIIQDMPYDRDRTTMRAFKMCPRCQAEYDNPLDRRFHAQPNACPVCGPSLEIKDRKGKTIDTTDAISYSARLLKGGNILAIKGLGGFLLACDATNTGAVEDLRNRKKRPSKPYAVMAADLESAKEMADISPAEADLLMSPQSPIVLVHWKKDSVICRPVAPGLKYIGLMLPYTPVHHLLLKEAGVPLVMTSGNISEEPIARDNGEALARLSGIADYFLLNNRDIYARYDDSVTFIENNDVQVIRRARGFAPYPVKLPDTAKQLLAMGADEKNTFCLVKDGYAFVSQHIGDLDNMETETHLKDTLQLYEELFRVKPEQIVHDLHPDYRSTRIGLELAAKSGLPGFGVQHHYAHIASCMADNGITGPVIGVALDGTGYGTDGNIWGSEFLVCDYKEFKRMGHLQYLPLPGGDVSTKRPYRIAIAYLLTLLGPEILNHDLPFIRAAGDGEIRLIQRQIQQKINTPLTSSMGRLFDAVSALLGIRRVIDYEAQAAIGLEMEAYAGSAPGNYDMDIIRNDDIYEIKIAGLLSQVVSDFKNKKPASAISSQFHNTIVKMIVDMCLRIRQDTGMEKVALSGGVFQNRLLLRETVPALTSAGFDVYTHRQVPCNDGGISLGQAAIALNKFQTG